MVLIMLIFFKHVLVQLYVCIITVRVARLILSSQFYLYSVNSQQKFSYDTFHTELVNTVVILYISMYGNELERSLLAL